MSRDTRPHYGKPTRAEIERVRNRIRELALQNLTAKEIAYDVDRGVSRVSSVLKSLKIKRVYITELEHATILRQREELTRFACCTTTGAR